MKARTPEKRRGRAEEERRRYAAKRLASLRVRFTELPPDVLGRAPLRRISVTARRVGVGQRTLSAFSEAEGSSDPFSNIYFATFEKPSPGS